MLAGAISTLRNTYIHIPGVGYSTERKIWREGAKNWVQFFQRRESLQLSQRLLDVIEEKLEESMERLQRQDQKYFASTLPSREYWRAYDDFKREVAFLDIETTGLSPDDSVVTVIGIYDGRKTYSFVRGDNISDFSSAIRKYKLLVTYNGARFDLPFLLQSFHNLRFDQIHVDLRYPLRRLGFSGGLKAIERHIGIKRKKKTEGLTGIDAVKLWHAHEHGEDGALDLLLEYNAEDVKNLEMLMDLSYRTLKGFYLHHGFTSGSKWK